MNETSIDPTVEEVMRDESASEWLKGALSTALERDPVDALNDAFLLAAALEERLRTVLALHESK
jgi:regulator of sirC expression with transglutaminase-like and TPR domain